MELLYKAFDLFLAAARKLATYLPQSGDDIIHLFQQFMGLTGTINAWIAENIGINFQRLMAPLGRLVMVGFSFFFELVKNIVARL